MNNVKETFLNPTNGCRDNYYCTITVCGCTVEEFHRACIEAYGDKLLHIAMDGVLLDNGSICCDFHKEEAVFTAYALSGLLPNAVVYGESSWNSHSFVCFKNASRCQDFTARWTEGEEPFSWRNDDEEWDDYEERYECNFIVHDNASGIEFEVLGGECGQMDYEYYQSILDKHPHKNITLER